MLGSWAQTRCELFLFRQALRTEHSESRVTVPPAPPDSRFHGYCANLFCCKPIIPDKLR